MPDSSFILHPSSFILHPLGVWRGQKSEGGSGKGGVSDLHLRRERPSILLYSGNASMQGRVFLGRYETIRLLGEGGMGRVYLARQLDLGRQVVVKVMHDHVAADPKFRERFARETLLMARFQHPYAVTLYDASLTDPQGSCIVMEYIRGVTLDSLLHTHGRLPCDRVSRLLRQL